MPQHTQKDKKNVDSASYCGINIYRLSNGAINVEGGNFPSVIAALRHVAREAKIEYDDNWNTRYFGWILIQKLNGNSSNTITEPSAISNSNSSYDNIAKIRQILLKIQEARREDSLYTSDKNAITTIFDCILNPYSYSSILVKLTVIDSLYSTQMGRRYYGLDELAKVLTELHAGKSLSEKFKKLSSLELTKAEFSINNGHSNLFDECYGIGKDGEDKGTAVSLITKYAYFETKGNFPIYDSIAREMYPKIWNYCSFPRKDCPTQVSLLSIESFIKAINILRDSINVNGLTYDDIDRLLWTTGKIVRGNLSLVLNREEYDFVSKQGYLASDGFHISSTSLDQLPFLENKPLLKSFFYLAKELA
ncbi:MAG: hypothetical protein MJY55_01075 [Bacteroidales bacterium]|nr:hypothetical protein [Bacteroidales bacterium]